MPRQKTALEYIWEIDEKLKEAKKKGWQRMGVQWGKWSHDMNIQSAQDLSRNKNKKPDVNDLINRLETSGLPVKEINEESLLVFKYWQNRSTLLEIYNAKNIFKLYRKYSLDREASSIKNRIYEV